MVKLGRPDSHVAPYFPFFCKDGRTLFILESKYQCKGTGFFTNVMRFLALTRDHHYCIADESDRLYFFSKAHCDEESAMDMINIMVKTGKIDADLWNNNQVLASEDLLNSLKRCYEKRENPIISMDQIRTHYHGKPLTGPGKSDSPPGNAQSKVKKSKVKKIYLVGSQEIRLSERLLSWILGNNQNYKKPNLQAWAKEIDLMIRIDKRTPEDIEKVIDFCQTDGFWKVNILSTAKLREKFDQLWLKMKGKVNGESGGKGAGRAQPELSSYQKCEKCGEEYQETDMIIIKGIKCCPKCPEVREESGRLAKDVYGKVLEEIAQRGRGRQDSVKTRGDESD